MPWTVQPHSAPAPLLTLAADDPSFDGLVLTDATRAFLDGAGRRAKIAEVDGGLCATLVAAAFAPGDARPSLEAVDLVLRPGDVIMRRRVIAGACPLLDVAHIQALWAQAPDRQRDASVLFLVIIDAVVDASNDVLGEIRSRLGQIEERMLAANPPLNRLQSEILELSHHLGSVRDGLVPLRGEMRELAELRDPVERGLLSEAGGRWLRSIELDLTHEIPAALGVAESRIAGALAQLQGERGEATNRVVLLLTIITVAFFLPTLLTGLYGMNVPLPADRHEWVFWGIVGLAAMFIAVAATAITRLGLWGTFRTVLPWTTRPEPLEPPPPGRRRKA